MDFTSCESWLHTPESGAWVEVSAPASQQAAVGREDGREMGRVRLNGSLQRFALKETRWTCVTVSLLPTL